MESIIELREAEIPRAQVTSPLAVLHDVTWRVERGDLWVIGALPGEGKTDLLCTTAGLQRPLKGKQYLFGKETHEMSEEELVETRLRIAMVFEGGRLFNALTVAQNIALPLSYHKNYDPEELSRRVGEALERTGLAQYEARKPLQLTRNLHQRVGLARALALEPEVLIVDNPLATIDPRHARLWLDFLCEANKSMTLVVAVDDLRAWTDVGKRFAVLREKHLEVIGGREEVKHSSDPLVRELMIHAFTSE